MSESLENLRKQIDELDGELMDVLAKRMNVVRKIGTLKKAEGIPPLDAERWRAVMESKILKARSFGISEKFIENLYSLIHEYSLEIQDDKEQL